jgi:hypothetical protein
VKEFYYVVVLAIEFEAHSVFDIRCFSHKNRLLYFDCLIQ